MPQDDALAPFGRSLSLGANLAHYCVTCVTPDWIFPLKPDQSALPETDPIGLFTAWFAQARDSEPNDANAMALATATTDGAPSVRMVLLKEYGAGGFTFYTNAQSRKGSEILANPQAALLFHWKSLRRQVRIEGRLREVSAAQADAYFHSRAFVSQVGSAASDQSRPLDSRATYIARVEQLGDACKGAGEVPRPPHWTGFTLDPQAIEFWLDRDNRLHDRRRFTRAADGGWASTLLYP